MFIIVNPAADELYGPAGVLKSCWEGGGGGGVIGAEGQLVKLLFNCSKVNVADIGWHQDEEYDWLCVCVCEEERERLSVYVLQVLCM